LVEGYRIHKLNEVLVKYRVHSSSSTIIENKKGVRKKIIRFKLSYLKERITKRRFKYYDYKVLISLIKDFLKPIVPRFFYLMKRIYRKNPLKAIQQLFVLLLNYRRIKKAEYLFFFPFYHIGGAEKVHTAILETVSDKKSVTLITSLSENKAMYDAFSKLTKVIEINHLIEFTRINNWLIRKFELITNRNPKLVLFGCNSKFYYELLPFLPTNNKCIDLIHAFVHDNEIGAEHWSLPVVLRLTYRIVINSKVFEDIKFQYSINGINENLLNRVKVIENYVSIPDKMNKKDNNILQVLYVGRDSTEKRLYLIAAIARKCQEQNIKAKFIFVSNVLSFKKEDYIYCEFKGEIRNESILNELYKKADLLLLTSSREGFPMVIMEAMSYGVVPVSTNVGGISKHVEDHVNGLLFNSTKEADIIDEMTQAIAQLDVDRSSLNKMSANAFSYAKQNFSKEIFDIAYANILGKN
jgi:glycosyltransferase involved in cell wall biosynthesis